MRYSDYSKSKRRLIYKLDNNLGRQVSKAEAVLADRILAFIEEKLDTSDGVVKNTKANLNKVQNLDGVWEEFKKQELLPIIKEMVADFRQIHRLNTGYYESVFTKTKMRTIRNNVEDATRQRLGLDEKGNVVRGSYIDELIRDRSILREIKRFTLLHVTSDVLSKSQLLKGVRNLISGKNVLQNHFRTFVNDTYAEYDRTTGAEFAEALNLTHAIYAGGVIEGSRPFCRFRNRKVFTKEQIQKFGTGRDNFKEYAQGNEFDAKGKPIPNGGYTNASRGEFAGKNTPYNPIVSAGGHGCRHTLNWVTESQARRLGWKE